MNRLGDVFRVLEARVACGSAEAQGIGDKLRAAIPLGRRQAKSECSDKYLVVRAVGNIDLAREFAILCEGCDCLESIY